MIYVHLNMKERVRAMEAATTTTRKQTYLDFVEQTYNRREKKI
jgi:hypothetical protein